MNALPLRQLLLITLPPTLLPLYGAWLYRRSANRISRLIDCRIEKLDAADKLDGEDAAFRQEHNELRRRLGLPPV